MSGHLKENTLNGSEALDVDSVTVNPCIPKGAVDVVPHAGVGTGWLGWLNLWGGGGGGGGERRKGGEAKESESRKLG